MPILAETSGKNAIIVTPHADFDLAAADVAKSAFGHAGQKCSAASLVVLVGSVAKSERFRNQLLDAVRSLKVGTPDNLDSQMGPVIAPPSGKLLRGLTRLGHGERWVIEPQPVETDHPLAQGTAADEAGGEADGEAHSEHGEGSQGTASAERGTSTKPATNTKPATKLWTPGVRDGVRRGSEYHLTEYFGPILGIMTADTLDEAIAIVNETDYGLTSGLHSLDQGEIAHWLDGVHAGNLYVNRGITGAIVRRQSFGGWKKSAIGNGTKAGGPSYLYAFGEWVDQPLSDPSGSPHPSVTALFEAAARHAETGNARSHAKPAEGEALDQPPISAGELSWLRAALASDAEAWNSEFGAPSDPSQLGYERNLLRYVATPVIVRIAADAPAHAAVRVIAAGVLAGSKLTVSTPHALPKRIAEAIVAAGVTLVHEDEAAWHERLGQMARRGGSAASARVRVVAGRSREQEVSAVFAATGGKPDIAVYGGEVVSAGRVEMLPFLREQAVSITAHRFGTPDHLTNDLI